MKKFLNTRKIILPLAITLLLALTLLSLAYFTDRDSNTAKITVGSFEADGYTLTRELFDVIYTAGEDVNITLLESNAKAEPVKSVISMKAAWESADLDAKLFGNDDSSDDAVIKLNNAVITKEDNNLTVDSDGNVTFDLPEQIIDAGEDDVQRVLTISIPETLGSTGNIEVSFTNVKVSQHPKGFTNNYTAEDLEASDRLDFSVKVGWAAASDDSKNMMAYLNSGDAEGTYELNFELKVDDSSEAMKDFENSSESAWSRYKIVIVSITIEDGAESIGAFAFSDFENLTSITIPDSVTRIGDNAFKDCDNLAEVNYGGTMADWREISIGSGNESLTNTIIKCSDGDIEPGSGEDATIPGLYDEKGEFTPWENLVSENKVTVDTFSDGLYAWKAEEKETIIKETDVIISGKTTAYQRNMVLTVEPSEYSITADDLVGLVLTAGSNYKVHFLSTDTVFLEPENTTLGYTFTASTNTVRFKSSLDNAIYSGSKTITRSNTVTETVRSWYVISNDSTAYPTDGSQHTDGYYYTLLTSEEVEALIASGDINGDSCILKKVDPSVSGKLVLPDNIISIGDGAFEGCSNITSITIPDSVTRIGDNAFKGCDNLAEVNYGGTMADWREISFGSGNESLINNTIKCSDGSTKYIPPGIYDEEGDFTSWETLVNENKVTIDTFSDGLYAWKTEEKETITTETTVTISGSKMLSGTEMKLTVEPNDYPITADDLVGLVLENPSYQLYFMSNKMAVDSKTDTVYNYEFNRSTNTLTFEYDLLGAYNSFSGSKTIIKSATITNTVRSWYVISNDSTAYPTDGSQHTDGYYYTLLTSEEVEDLIASGDINGDSCVLKKVDPSVSGKFVIPDNVVSIGEGAFEGCSNITSITIPNSVTSIGNDAFKGSDNLAEVIYGGIQDDWREISIGSGNEALTNTTIKCSDGYIEPGSGEDATSLSIYNEDEQIDNQDYWQDVVNRMVAGETKFNLDDSITEMPTEVIDAAGYMESPIAFTWQAETFTITSDSLVNFEYEAGKTVLITEVIEKYSVVSDDEIISEVDSSVLSDNSDEQGDGGEQDGEKESQEDENSEGPSEDLNASDFAGEGDQQEDDNPSDTPLDENPVKEDDESSNEDGSDEQLTS